MDTIGLDESAQAVQRSSCASRDTSPDFQSVHNKLWKLGSNPFVVLGEARVRDHGVSLGVYGDLPPEPRLGLAEGSFPKNIKATLDMMHPEDSKAFERAAGCSLATGEPFDMNYRLCDGRGGWRWLQSRAICIEEREGKYIQWLSDTRDITEQKKTEEALRTSLEELRYLKAQLQSENVYLREEVDRGTEHGDIIGQSPALTRVIKQLELVSATSSTVLISGETGTGKELIARAIHHKSNRCNRLFVAVNCAALPPTLVESELFGHEKGAFTGATARRAGRFEQADAGTLFLDEVGEMPMETQAKMLRVLQSGEFERVGGGKPLKVNVRVIAASNRNLEQAVHEGRFRSDLYHRLSIFPIHLPPLRERREDIPLMVAYLVHRKAIQLGRNIQRIPNLILERLSAYDWPGNVRELENVLERAIILSPGTALRQEAIQLGPAVQVHPHPIRTDATLDAAESDTLEARERVHILHICHATSWKIKGPDGAAIRLGLNPATLYFRMKKLGIKRPTAQSR